MFVINYIYIDYWIDLSCQLKLLLMMKTNFVIIISAILVLALSFSCQKEDKPKAVIKVVEYIDSVSVPVSKAKIEVRPATNEEVLEDVIASGYTNSGGSIEFEFDKELVLRATAYKYQRDDAGQIIYNNIGNPIVLKTGYKTLILQTDYTDNKTIEVK